MNRVYGLNASASPPVIPGTLETGYPKSSGDSTIPGYWWYYLLTETLLDPIIAAGLTPSNSSLTQLTEAIVILARQNSVTSAYLPARAVDTVGVTLSGIQTVDGYATVNGDRILRAVGGLQINNGPWVVNSAGAWTRPLDWAAGAVVPEGVLIEIADGTVNSNSVWTLDIGSSANCTVGTTAINFVDITASVKAMFASYLTTAAAATTYLTQTNAASTYLTIANATSTYLTLTAAASTYLTQTNANTTYLSKTAAASTYLTITTAASTYITSALANSTFVDNTELSTALSSYLTTAAAASTYLTQTNANTTYLSKTTAASTYQTITTSNTQYNYLIGTPQITGLAVNCTFGGVNGYVYASGDLIAGYSDDRLKQRIKTIDKVMEGIMSLDVFTYRPNAYGIELGLDNKVDIGLSAQQVKLVCPELIERSPIDDFSNENSNEELMTIKYQRATAILVAGLKETYSLVNKLLDRIQTLENKG